MLRFYNIYENFEVFFNSFFNGNEVEFLYKNTRYCILPVYNEKAVMGVRFGKAYEDADVYCTQKDELYNVNIGNEKFGEILGDIEILWYNC